MTQSDLENQQFWEERGANSWSGWRCGGCEDPADKFMSLLLAQKKDLYTQALKMYNLVGRRCCMILIHIAYRIY
jgi:hypothetical protein